MKIGLYRLGQKRHEVGSKRRSDLQGQVYWCGKVLATGLIALSFLLGVPQSNAPFLPDLLKIDMLNSDVLSVRAASNQEMASQESDGILAVVGAEGTTVFTQPGDEMIDVLDAGDVVTAVARSADSDWVLVELDGDESGWVEVSSLVLFGASSLPLIDVKVDDTEADTGAEDMSEGDDNETDSEPAVATPSPTATQVAPTEVPTNTAEPTATIEPTPASEAGAAPSGSTAFAPPNPGTTVVAVIRSDDSKLYTIPDGEVLESLRVGTSLTLIGRTESMNWLQVMTDGGRMGWVESPNVVAFRVNNVPIVSPDSMMASNEVSSDESTDESAMSSSDDESQVDTTDSSAAEAESSTQQATTEQSATGQSSTDQSAISAPSSQQGGAAAGTAVVSSDITRLNVRAGPGLSYSILGVVNANTSYRSLGRSNNSAWIYIGNPTSSVEAGWVSASFVSVSGSVSSLPVMNTIVDVPASNSTTPQTSNDSSTASQPAQNAAPAGGLTGKLVFQSELGGPIYIYNMVSGSLSQITTGFDPALSPDGQWVAFTRLGANGGVYVIDVNGANERRLFPSDRAPRSPSWSPDGSKVVFSRLTGEFRCTNLGFGICINLPFARTFGDKPQETKEERGLSVIEISGENFRDIAALNTANAPHWVSSGIVYQATTSLEITEDSPEDENRVIINQVVGYRDPNWRFDGGRVLFQSQEGSHWEIFGINPDGGGIAALTRPVTTLVDELPSNVSPAWSPDGNSIVYVSNRDDNNSAGPWRIWVMNSDGSNQRPLPINVPMNYQFNQEQMVSWSR